MNGPRYQRKKPPKDDAPYRKIWRIVDGAVQDAFNHHPEYLTEAGSRNARLSIVKRVTGSIKGYAEQSAQGRSETARRSSRAKPKRKARATPPSGWTSL